MTVHRNGFRVNKTNRYNNVFNALRWSTLSKHVISDDESDKISCG